MGKSYWLIPFALLVLCSCSPRVSTFHVSNCVGGWIEKHRCANEQKAQSDGFVDVQINTQTAAVSVHNYGGSLGDQKRFLAGCSVVDERNWECIKDNHGDRISGDIYTEGMDDGVYYFSNIAAGGFYQLHLRGARADPLDIITRDSVRKFLPTALLIAAAVPAAIALLVGVRMLEIALTPVARAIKVVENSPPVDRLRRRWMQIGLIGRAVVIGLLIIGASIGWRVTHPLCDQCRNVPPPPMSTV